MQRQMEEADHPATSVDSLLACCLCRRLLQDAVQLVCLHNCCRQCFRTAALAGNSQDVTCDLCNTVTQAGRQQPNVFIDNQVQRLKLVADSRICGKCKENGKHDKPAVLWCPACRQALCEGCVPLHNQYFISHVAHPLGDLKGLDEVLSQKSLSVCVMHQMPLDIACCNCEQVKCITCWAECNEKKHEMHVVGKDSFDSYVAELVACMGTMERELLQKSEVLKKPNSVLLDTKSARDRHLEDLKKRKRLVVDAVDMVYQEMELATKSAYDSLESECDAAAAVANRIGSDLSDARSYVRRLVESNDKCEIVKQQKFVRERLSMLSAKLDTLSDHLTTSMQEVKIEASLPDDFGNVIRSWIGKPHICSGSLSHPTQLQHPEQQQQGFSFGINSVSVLLPVKCMDVTLTAGGRSLLLAAGQYGLLEFCSSNGHELSYWLPQKYGNSDDHVSAVTALSKGRAALFLRESHVVVLLRPREQGESNGNRSLTAPGDVWTVEHRVELGSYSLCLSGHGDVLAFWESGCTLLRLVSSSSWHRLSTDLLYESSINSVAVASRVLVTAHAGSVEARSLPYGQQLWRHELSSVLQLSVCSDSIGGYLYAAVCGSDSSTGRVSVLSVVDGSELRRVALSFDTAATPQPLPGRLSLSEDAAGQLSRSPAASTSGRVLVLAALCSDSATGQCRTVMVHRSTCGVP